MMNQFKNKKILVIGDLIIDVYKKGRATGKSSESPTIVMEIESVEKYIGGAGVVANQIVKLGGKAILLTVHGQSEHHELGLLIEQGITPLLFYDSTRETSEKERLIADNYKLLRINKIYSEPICQSIEDKIIDSIFAVGMDCDAIVISDFSYGVITDKIISAVKFVQEKQGVLILGDSQSGSQIGDITKFEGFDLITPTRREARMALNDAYDNDFELVSKIAEKTKSKAVCMTMGSEGFIYADGYEKIHYPAVSQEYKDTTGAGDSMLAAFALCMASKMETGDMSAIASHVAWLKCQKEGNEPVSLIDLNKFIRQRLYS